MLKSASSVFLVSSLLGLVACADNKQVTVKHGEDAPLECYGPPGASVIMLRWKKPDLDKQRYVLFIRENRNYENLQLPSFKGRVQLRDPQMKDGDFSVIIKDVSMNDAGIYECYAGYDTQDPQLMSNITLKVEEPGQRGGQSGDDVNEDGGEKSGSIGLIVGLSVSAVLIVVAAVVFITYRKRRNQSDLEYRPPLDQVL